MSEWMRQVKSIVTHPLFPVALICFLSLGLRLYRLPVPSEWYFDEVYHGYTAVEYAKGNHAAYDPWASSPKGVAFEWVHPPLAKIIMSWSVMAFGAHSWAWRLPSAFFGTAVTGLTGVLAWVWFKDRRVALLASTFLALDGLNLVMSRLAMNDVFFLSFLLFTVIVYSLAWRERYSWRWMILAGLGLGAALASKWTTLYIIPILGIDLLWRWQQSKTWRWTPFFSAAACLALIPPLVYLLSYAQYFAWGYSWESFVTLQKQIWWYHTGLEATHPYQSTPLQWLLDLRPVWFYSGSTSTLNKNIYALGNPIFFWAGLSAVLFQIHNVIQRQRDQLHSNWAQIQVLLCYFAMWLPWTFSPRIMFFYHYLPALPFLSIMLAYTIRQLEIRNKQSYRFIGLGLVSLMGLWLIIFFPHLTGIAVSKSWSDSVYFFIPTWR